MHKKYQGFLFIVLLCFCLISVGRTQIPVDENQTSHNIRIAILKEVEEVTLKIRGRYEIIDPQTQQILQEGRRLKRTKVVPSTHGMKVGDYEYVQSKIRIIPRKDVSIYIHKKERRYRGHVDIIRTKEAKLLVVNQLDIEDYIRGVLYHEVSHRWPLEALKVQAVAARTYALYRMKENVKNEFDVTNDIYSQVYGGRISEKYRTNIAVKQTIGEVMLFNADILPAYYHATCGGHSENAAALWKHDDILPLRGVTCRFCTTSPHYHWKKNFRLKNIQDSLNKNGYHIGLIKEIRVLERNASDRNKTLEIITRDGKSIPIAGKDFRQIIGPNKIKSNNYYVVMKGYYCDLIGKGWGHGVGMCQWGAQEMARQRFDYKDILEFYYPGIRLADYRLLNLF